MITLIMLYLICSSVYIFMGLSILSNDLKSKMNIIFFIVCLNLSFWAFTSALMTGSTDPGTAIFYNKLSALSWSTLSSWILYLFIYLTKKESNLKKLWLKVMLFLPAMLSIYLYCFEPVTGNEIVRVSYGWAFLVPKNKGLLYEYFYGIYFIVYSIADIWLILDFGKKSKFQREHKQSKIIAYAFMLTLLMGSITDIFFPLLGITLIPQLAIISILIVSGGIWYSVLKYRFMNLTTESVVLDVLKIMNEGLIISDPEGRIISANRGACKLLGYEETELIGQSVSIVFADKVHLSKRDTSISCEIDILSKYNERIPVLNSSSVLLDDFGDELGIVFIFQNISKIKQIQNELKNTHDNLEKRVLERTYELSAVNIQLQDEIQGRKIKEIENREYLKTIEKQAEQLQIITNNMNDELFIINKDGSYDYLNQRAYDMTFKPEYAKKYGDTKYIKHYDEYGKELRRQELPCSRVLEGETIENVQLKIITPDKTSYYSFNGSPVFNEIGEISSVIVCRRDVTEKYIHEEEIRQRKEQLVTVKMEAEMKRLDGLNLIGEMGASIAHEIRNPMTSVRGFLQLLGSKPNLLEYNNYFQLMIDEIDRANSIISEFLLISKNAPRALSMKNFNNIIKNLQPMIQADFLRNDLNIIVELDEIPDLELDEKEIRQVILNLARNGLEAMSAGGVLTIRTYLEGEQTVISFRDQGSGIPPEILENISKPFLTTKENGTGLGLAVSYNIVQRHGGTISIETGADGTTFFIKVPLKQC